MRTPGLLALLALFPAACDDPSPSVGDALSVPLVTRDGVQAGTVTVSNSTTNLRVDIAAQDGWTLEKVRAAAGASLAHIPQTPQGQPLPERFPLRSKTESVTSVHFSVPLSVEPGTELIFAVAADVRDKAKETQQDCGMEPAWGAGTPFPRKPEAMYFTYVVQKSGPPSLAGMYRTHTQEQWGGAASAADAPGYLLANFAATYPRGVTIGATLGFTARFTSASAVATFLPQAGPALFLERSWTNPLDLSNALAGETLALALNVDFDDRDAGFSSGVTALGDLLVADGTSLCFGRTVREVLGLANQILAGVPDPSGMGPEAILECVARINRNFEDGVADLGYLGLP